MKQGLTSITRGIIYLMGFALITVCAILLPELAREESVGRVTPPSPYPFLIGAWILSTPIFVALHQTLKLLSHVDGNKAFSNHSVKTLQNIKFCSIVFSAMIIVGVVTVVLVTRSVNPTEDVTPIVTLGFVFTFVSSAAATFIAVLQKLLKVAIDIKSENDLTV